MDMSKTAKKQVKRQKKPGKNAQPQIASSQENKNQIETYMSMVAKLLLSLSAIVNIIRFLLGR